MDFSRSRSPVGFCRDFGFSDLLNRLIFRNLENGRLLQEEQVPSNVQAIFILAFLDGIGAEYARQLAKAGQNIIIVGRNQMKLEAMRKEITEASSVNVELVRADLSKQVSARIKFSYC